MFMIFKKLTFRIFGLPLLVIHRASAYRKKLRCTMLLPFGKLYPSSAIYNIHGDRRAIQIGAHSHVLGQLLVYKHGGKISIGKYSFIGEGTKIWAASSIEIGDRVLISHGVNVHDNDSHSLSATDRHQQILAMFSTGHPSILVNVPAKPIIIENDAWVGLGSTILKGVRIGEGAVVGAGSVITKDVAAYTIVAGNPARVIGSSKK